VAISETGGMQARRWAVPILAVPAALLLSGPASSLASNAVARVPTGSMSTVHGQSQPPLGSDEESGQGNEQAVESAESHGGPIGRVHEGCPFPDGAEAPSGNWTHGDYVSAWAAADGARAAGGMTSIAHSPCGKPAHGGRPHREGKDSPGRSGQGAPSQRSARSAASASAFVGWTVPGG
jgi:hypothetical protein